MQRAASCDVNDCYILPVPKALLLFSPLRKAALCVRADEPTPRKLGAAAKGTRLGKFVARLRGTPLLVPDGGGVSLRPPFLGMLADRACTMGCRYCDFESAEHAGSRLGRRQAFAMVDWFAAHQAALGERRLPLHFFGGEPTMRIDFVTAVVEHARRAAGERKLEPYFEINTNGFFGADKTSFLARNFDTVILSLDGFERDHDRHRPLRDGSSSFAVVCRTAERLRELPVKLCIRCCVSAVNVRRMEETALWFSGRFRPSVINFEPLVPGETAARWGLSPPDPFAFASGFAAAAKGSAANKARLVYSAIETEEPQHTFCPVGRDTLILGPDGDLRSCYLPKSAWRKRGLDLVVGRVSPEGDVSVSAEQAYQLRELVAAKPRCLHCFCKWSCAGGCHVNHSYPGCSDQFDSFCLQTRTLMIWKLLHALGEERLADDWMGDRTAMERTARQPSDSADDVLTALYVSGGGRISVGEATQQQAGDGGQTSTSKLTTGRNEVATPVSSGRWVIPYIDQPASFWEELCTDFREHIKEVYLPLRGVGNLSGRPLQPDVHVDDFMDRATLPFSLLINPVVFPRPVEQIADEIVAALSILQSSTRLSGVTVSNVTLAERIKRDLPDLSVTASVLMAIESKSQFPLLSKSFDAIVPSSSIMRDLPALRALRLSFQGKIRLLVNEGCLPACQFRTQHFFEMAQGSHFPASLCAGILETTPWLRLTGAWVLPSFLGLYDGLCDEYKLAGRVTLRDVATYRRVFGAYVRREVVTPDVLGGGPAMPQKPLPISEAFFKHTLSCTKNCVRCDVCREYYEQVR